MTTKRFHQQVNGSLLAGMKDVYAPFSAPVRRCRPTEHFIIQPYSWQSYGRYTSGERAGSIFAAPVRASNEYMARDAVLRQVFPDGPVIEVLHQVASVPRSEGDRARFRRSHRRAAEGRCS